MKFYDVGIWDNYEDTGVERFIIKAKNLKHATIKAKRISKSKYGISIGKRYILDIFKEDSLI